MDGENSDLLRSKCGEDCMGKCFKNFGAALVPGNRESLLANKTRVDWLLPFLMFAICDHHPAPSYGN
jgi:hypothetical protein